MQFAWVYCVGMLRGYVAWLYCVVVVRGYAAWVYCVVVLRGYIAWVCCVGVLQCKLHILTLFQQKYIFCNKQDNKCVFHYLFALRESLNVFSEVQNAFNANKMRCFKKKKLRSLLPQNVGYHQLLKISEVFNGESPIDQHTEHLTLTDILKIKYTSVVSCGLVFSENITTYLLHTACSG